jgi:hypothetical protein
MIYLRLSKQDDVCLAKAAKRFGKSKVAFAREAIVIKLPILEQEAVEEADGAETES